MTGTNTIAAGTTVTAGYTIAVGTGPNFTLINLGIVGTPSTGYGVKDLAAGNTIVNAGIAQGSTGGGTGIGLLFGGTVINESHGTIRGAVGVYAKANGTIDNYGQITGFITRGGSGTVEFKAGGSLTNETGGLISGYYAVIASGSAVAVTNAGTIAGNLGGVVLRGGGSVSQFSTTASIAAQYAIKISGGTGIVTNAGTINGGQDGVELDSGGSVTNDTGALITGHTGVHILSGAGTVWNSGTIASSGGTIVGLAAGYTNLLALYPSGNLSNGAVNGGNAPGSTAVSTLELASVSGSSVGTLAGIGKPGIIGFNRLVVQSGASWVISNDSIAASMPVIDLGTLSQSGSIFSTVTVGADGSFNNTGIINAGTYGVLATAGSATVSNGGTIIASSTGILLAQGGSVDNTGVINGSQFGIEIELTPGAVYNSGLISASSNVAVFLKSGGSIFNDHGTIFGEGTGVYISGGVGTVFSAGTINADGSGGFGVVLKQGGAVYNDLGVISGGTGVAIYGGAGTVFNEGTIASIIGQDAVKLAAGFSNRVVFGQGGSFTGTVDGGNAIGGTAASTIELLAQADPSTRDQFYGFGTKYINFENIQVDAGGYWLFDNATLAAGVTVIDNGRLTTDNTILSTVTMRSGAIMTLEDGAKILAANYGVVDQAGPGTFANNGSIIVTSVTKPFSFDIALEKGGYVENGFSGVMSGALEAVLLSGSVAGTVENFGLISGNAEGIDLEHGGTVTNAGTILALSDNGYGVFSANAPATIVNHGTIGGGVFSVWLSPGYANVVDFSPSAVFNGVVNGGNTVGAAVVSTLALGSGASAGTFGGFGGKYLNFSALRVDPGATWTLASAQAIVATEQVTDAGTLINISTILAPVTVGAGGYLDNESLINARAASAVTVTGAGGLVVNAGTIAGSAYGSSAGVRLGSTGTVVNLANGGISGSYGVYAAQNATVTNFGDITGQGNEGIVLTAGGTVVNDGTISGDTGIVILNGNGVVTNAGTIAGPGGDAVLLAAGQTNAVSMTPQAVFTGIVSGGNSVGSTAPAALWLMQGTTSAGGTYATGTLAGVGTVFQAFNTIAVAAGANWVVPAGSTIGAGIGPIFYDVTDLGTLTNDGAIESPTTVAGLGVLTNAASAVISPVFTDTATPGAAVYETGGSASVTNAGTIGSRNSLGTDGLLLGNGGSVLNEASGVISGFQGIVALASADVTNAGTIVGAYGYAVSLARGVANTVRIAPGATFFGNVYGGDTVGGTAVSTLELQAGSGAGTLSGFGSQYTGFTNLVGDAGSTWTLAGNGVVPAGVVISEAGTLVNAGTLLSTVTLVPGEGSYPFLSNASTGLISTGLISTGAYAVTASSGPVTVVNAGTITSSSGPAIGLPAGGFVANRASAVISGAIGILLAPSGTVVNAGLISGGVYITNGGYVYNQQGGTLSGSPVGIRAVNGVGSVDNGGLIQGSAVVHGYGVGLYRGGNVNNLTNATIAGSQAGVVIRGGAGTVHNFGTIIGNGGTAVQLAAGYINTVLINAQSVFSGVVDGGNPLNGTAGSTLELFQGTASGTLSGFGTQFINFETILVDPFANWTLSGQGLVAGETVVDHGTLTNLASVPGGVSMSGSATLVNGGVAGVAGSGIGVKTGTVGTSALVDNQGTILGGSDGISLGNGGEVINRSSAVVQAPVGILVQTGTSGVSPPATVANYGVIRGGSSGQAYGVEMLTAGSILNQGLISGALGIAGRDGFITVDNQGTVTGNPFTGTGIFLSGGFVLNQGQITGAAVGVEGYGFVTTVINSGLITSGSAHAGILLDAGGTVFNRQGGVIVGGSSGYGVAIRYGSGTVVNAGSIGVSGAGASVKLAAGYANRLILYPGAQFSGAVQGGNTVGSTAVSTLELAGTTEGSLAGLGSMFTGFAAVQVDPGAIWDLTGQDSLAAGMTLTNQGTLVIGSKVSVDGVLIQDGVLQLGQNGSGALLIENGATLSVGTDLNIGQVAGGSGTVDVEGASTLSIGGNLNIGAAAPGTMTVGPNASVVLDNGGINQGSQGVLNLHTAVDSLFLSGGTVAIDATQIQDLPAYVSGAQFNLGSDVAYVLNTPTVYGGAIFTVGSTGSSLTLNADATSGDVQVGFADNTGTLVLGIDGLGTIETPALGTSGFIAEANPLLGSDLIRGFQGIISNFVAGDTIVVDTPSAASFAALGSTQVAVMTNGTTLGVIGFSTPAQASAALGTAGALVDNVVPCFAAGTRIRTAAGNVAVEALRDGDMVWSVLHQSFRPVVWIGQRTVDCAAHPAPHRVWPVCIAAGAFGPGQPVRDLYVSPDHALYVDGMLIPAKYLVNGETIRQIAVDTISYYHVELRQHDVLLAEGLAAESYLDTGDRANFVNGGAVVTLHPSWGDRWELEGCAPLVVHGPALRAVRERLCA